MAIAEPATTPIERGTVRADVPARAGYGRLVRVVAIIAAVALALTAAWRYTPLAEVITPDAIIGWTETFAGYWWAPLAIMLAYTPANLVLFPRPLLTLAAVVAFGPVAGFGYAMSGILLSAAVVYWLGRLMPPERITKLAGRRSERFAWALKRNGLTSMTALMIVPLAPYAIIGMMAGCIRVKAWQFLAATFIGMTPGVLATAVFGNELESALRDPSQINWVVVAAVVGVMVALSFAVRRWFTRAAAAAA